MPRKISMPSVWVPWTRPERVSTTVTVPLVSRACRVASRDLTTRTVDLETLREGGRYPRRDLPERWIWLCPREVWASATTDGRAAERGSRGAIRIGEAKKPLEGSPGEGEHCVHGGRPQPRVPQNPPQDSRRAPSAGRPGFLRTPPGPRSNRGKPPKRTLKVATTRRPLAPLRLPPRLRAARGRRVPAR